jgi:periplasmic protein TonB
MNRLLTLMFFLTISTLTLAKSRLEPRLFEADTVYSLSDVDSEPIPEGGMESLYKKWNSFAKYPPQAKRHKIEGRVFLSFVIDENGNTIEPKVEKELGYGCDEAAVEALIKTKFKWTPATKAGKNVKVRLFLPFMFKYK